jgi:hypothetical protein
MNDQTGWQFPQGDRVAPFDQVNEVEDGMPDCGVERKMDRGHAR